MLLFKRFVVCLLVTASAFAQAQSFVAVDVKPARSVGLESRRVRTLPKMKVCVWVKPELVANFEFLEWTDSNHVRHMRFVSLPVDKDPRTVVRE
jgi:ATP-dependent DNA ligase